MTTKTSTAPLSMVQILLCGGAIVTLSMGIRHGFGLWLLPITQSMGWTRESFSLAIAVQNLSWGVLGIFVGMLADRIGAFKVLIGGSILYALGLVGMALSPTPLWFLATAGVLIGAAQAGTTYAVIYGVLGRQIPVARRSWAMGVTAAAGSFGQFFMVPVEGSLIASVNWSNALLILAVFALLIAALAFGLREPGFGGSTPIKREQTVGQALKEAWSYPSFLLLMAGYFVCGFQVMFIGVHMPSYLKDFGMAPQVASTSLALVGLFNIFGTYLAGAEDAQALSAVWHLQPALDSHHLLLAGSAVALVGLYLLRGHGLSVAVHRAADQCHHCPDLRRAAPVHAGRLCLLQPPDRQLPGRLAGRLSV